MVMALNAAPDSALVNTTTPSSCPGTRVSRDTCPGQPPVCQTSFWPR